MDFVSPMKTVELVRRKLTLDEIRQQGIKWVTHWHVAQNCGTACGLGWGDLGPFPARMRSSRQDFLLGFVPKACPECKAALEKGA